MICYEKTCEVCYGQPKPCAACGNTGTVPTEAGKALLGFLERHGPLLNQGMSGLQSRSAPPVSGACKAPPRSAMR